MMNPQEQAIDGGGVVQRNLDLNTKNITNGGDISGANANAYLLKNAAASSTVPTVMTDRASSTTGLGSGSGIRFIVAGSEVANVGAGQFWVSDGTLVADGPSTSGADAYMLQSAPLLLSGLSGATVTATNLIPAGSVVWGVVARVTTLITGASSFNIGDGTTANLWGNNVGLTVGTTTSPANFLSTFAPKLYTAATSVVLTANTSNFTAGAVRLVLYYYTLSAPTV